MRHQFQHTLNAEHDDDAAAEPCPCAWPNCGAIEQYPAPKSPQELYNYQYFCLQHIREFNDRWDFYRGQTPAQIEAAQRLDLTWERPTWRVGVHDQTPPKDSALLAAMARHPMFEEVGRQQAATIHPAHQQQWSTEERRCLNLLSLGPDVTLQQLKARFKVLVKQLHPDVRRKQGEARTLDHRLKQVISAYNVLKKKLQQQGAHHDSIYSATT